MMLEFLIGLCMVSVGVAMGLLYADQAVRRKMTAELHVEREALNKNLSEFAKAYADFDQKGLLLEQRLASLEFKLTGVMQTHPGGKR